MGKIKIPHFVKTDRMEGKGLLVLTNPGQTNLRKRVDAFGNIQAEGLPTMNLFIKATETWFIEPVGYNQVHYSISERTTCLQRPLGTFCAVVTLVKDMTGGAYKGVNSSGILEVASKQSLL